MEITLTERMGGLVRECILSLPIRVAADELDHDFEMELIRHGLLGGVCHALVTQATSDPVVLKWAKQRYRDQFFQAAGFQALLARLDRELAARNVSVLLLKGAHLFLTHYATVGTRHLSDIDLYIPDQASQPAVEQALSACGLRPPETMGSWQDDQGRVVDVHSSTDESVEGQLLDFSSVYQRSVGLPGYSHLRGMHGDDLAAYVALHALKHGFCKLSWLWDLQLLDASRPNPSLSGRARSYIGYIMNHYYRLGGQVPPISWLERLLIKRMLASPYSGLGQVMLSLAMNNPLKTTIFLFRSALFNNYANRKTLHLKGLRQKVRNILSALWG